MYDVPHSQHRCTTLQQLVASEPTAGRHKGFPFEANDEGAQWETGSEKGCHNKARIKDNCKRCRVAALQFALLCEAILHINICCEGTAEATSTHVWHLSANMSDTMCRGTCLLRVQAVLTAAHSANCAAPACCCPRCYITASAHTQGSHKSSFNMMTHMHKAPSKRVCRRVNKCLWTSLDKKHAWSQPTIRDLLLPIYAGHTQSTAGKLPHGTRH
jgi:hypothetical protein